MNRVADFSEIEGLKSNPRISTVYLQMNPVQKFPDYRQKIMETLPNIRQIDSFNLN